MNALCPKCLSAEWSSWHAVTMVKNSQQQQSYRGHHRYPWWLWEIPSWSTNLPFFQDEQGVGTWYVSVSVITRHKNIIKQRKSHSCQYWELYPLMRMSHSSFQMIVSATRALVLSVVSLRSDVNSSSLTGAFHWCRCLPWCQEINNLVYRRVISGLNWLAKVRFPRVQIFSCTLSASYSRWRQMWVLMSESWNIHSTNSFKNSDSFGN